MPLEKYVCVVGGANIDINGFSNASLRIKDSNPGKILLTFGGVGRNIAENLSKLGIKVDLITAFGKDQNSDMLVEDCHRKKINTTHCIRSSEFPCSTYIGINDVNGDVQAAISDMSCMELVAPSHIKKKMQLINHAQACVIDTNIPKETIKFIVENCKTKVFLDTVSTKKTELTNDVIKNLVAIKPNILEAEVLSGHKISSVCDLKIASKKIMSRNIQNVFISLGDQGVYFDNGVDSGIVPGLKTKVISSTGSGDSFMSAVVWANLQELDIISSVKAGIAAATICLESPLAVSEEMSVKKLKELMGEICI